MTDRIHPMHDSNHRHPGAPSAPPAHHIDTVTVQLPEKAIRKEQEEGLMSQHQHAQTREKTDRMYAAPPPPPHVFPGYGYTTEGGGAAGGYHRRPRRSACCCCLLSFTVTLGVLIVAAAIAALVVFLVVRPVRLPEYAIQGVEVEEFNLTGGSELSTEMELLVQARNRNTKIGIDYDDDIEVRLFYRDEIIGEGSIPGFYQGHRDTTNLTIPIQGNRRSLTPAAASALEFDRAGGDIRLVARAHARARVKIGHWKSRRRTYRVVCSLDISSRAPFTVLSSSCHLRRRRFFFLRYVIF